MQAKMGKLEEMIAEPQDLSEIEESVAQLRLELKSKLETDLEPKLLKMLATSESSLQA